MAEIAELYCGFFVFINIVGLTPKENFIDV